MIQQPITLSVNGESRQVEAGMSLPDLLGVLGVDRRVVAVAHNGEVIPRQEYDRVVLQEGDRIEIVRMVGGG